MITVTMFSIDQGDCQPKKIVLPKIPDASETLYIWIINEESEEATLHFLYFTASLTFGRACSRSAESIRASLCSHLIAALISSSRSIPASRPMLIRTVVSSTDISAHCSAVKRPKMVEAGWMASDLRSKRFVARRIICNLSMNAHAASFDSRSMVKTAPGKGPNCTFESS